MARNNERGRGVMRQRTIISDEIRATVRDHVLFRNEGIRTLSSAQPKQIHCVHHSPKIQREEQIAISGREGIYVVPTRETLILYTGRQNNAIKLHEIQQRIIEDHENFEGINSVSLSTIDRVLKRNRMQMKQLYRVSVSTTQRGSRREDSSMYRGVLFMAWKVYDRQPCTKENILQARELACNDVDADACQAWIWY